MKAWKQVLKQTVVAGMVASLGSGAAMAADAKQAKDIKIAVVTHGQASDTYWTAVKKGVDAAGKALGVSVSYQAPEQFDGIAMSRMISAAVAAKVDGLVVSIPDANALGKAIKAAVAAGIPVIAIDSGESDAQKLGARFYVGGASEFESGRLAGQQLAAAGVKKGICVNHEVGNVSLDERCDGFKKGLGKPVDVVAVTMDPTETTKRVSAYLDSHKDVNGIFTLGPTPAVSVLKGLQKKGTVKQYKFGTFDLSAEVLEAIAKGDMLFGIDSQQYLMGYLPVVSLTLNAMYGTMPINNIHTGPGFVTAKDAAKVLALSKQGLR